MLLTKQMQLGLKHQQRKIKGMMPFFLPVFLKTKKALIDFNAFLLARVTPTMWGRTFNTDLQKLFV